MRSVAESLRDENLEVKTSLERAESAIMIAERRLWDSLETIQDGFAVFDAERVMVAANRAYIAAFDGLEMIGPGVHYHEMLKIMCEEGIVDLEDTPPEDWRLMMAARWDSDRVGAGDGEALERRVQSRSSTGAPRDGDMVSSDSTSRRRSGAEAELERARPGRRPRTARKSAFLANMSHEIRTPMNGVHRMAEHAARKPPRRGAEAFRRDDQEFGEALLVIINDVLDYSKIEAKKLECTPRVRTRALYSRSADAVAALGTRQGLQLAVDYDMFMPTEFVGDPGRVRQILKNLAGNAVKFTGSGHVAIRVVGLPVRDGAAPTGCT